MLATRNSIFIVLFTCDMESDFSVALAYTLSCLKCGDLHLKDKAIRTIYLRWQGCVCMATCVCICFNSKSTISNTNWEG